MPDDPATLQLILRAALAEIERLRLMIAGLQRNRFGRRSEQLDDETLQQGVEDLEQSVAEQEAGLAAATTSPAEAQRAPKPAKRNRGALPAHLPRVEVVVDVEDQACPCCGAGLHRIGEDSAEMLDYVPAQLRVRVIRRPRYGCRVCEGAVVQAPAPERPIDGGLATEALLAQVLIGKYSDHLPLYRQSQIFARQGVTLDRSTLCNWVGRACWWLAPLHELMLSTVLASPRLTIPTASPSEPWPASPKVFADDTTLPVLDPVAGAPRPDGCGAMPLIIRLGRDQATPLRLTSTARTARRTIRPCIWRDSAACSRSMAMPGSAASSRPMPQRNWRFAGPIRGGNSTTSMSPRSRRSLRRRCGGSPPFT
jgi:transposase